MHLHNQYTTFILLGTHLLYTYIMWCGNLHCLGTHFSIFSQEIYYVLYLNSRNIVIDRAKTCGLGRWVKFQSATFIMWIVSSAKYTSIANEVEVKMLLNRNSFVLFLWILPLSSAFLHYSDQVSLFYQMQLWRIIPTPYHQTFRKSFLYIRLVNGSTTELIIDYNYKESIFHHKYRYGLSSQACINSFR